MNIILPKYYEYPSLKYEINLLWDYENYIDWNLYLQEKPVEKFLYIKK